MKTPAKCLWCLVLIVTLFVKLNLAAAKENFVQNIEKVLISELANAIDDYYYAESKKRWEKTYNMRPHEYKQIIGFHLYRNKMDEFMDGWSLNRVRIVGYGPTYDEYYRASVIKITIRFFDRMIEEPDDIMLKLLWEQHPNKIITTDEDTLWILENEGWRCLQCGQRHHMILNRRM